MNTFYLTITKITTTDLLKT
uniref:Uncharacterized protein n=1 Tax=Anguilla anguilla TaxID=7936 RepID=A0A0E9V5W9_ANGAN